MKTLKLFCFLLCGSMFVTTIDAAHLRANILLSAKMDGMQEVPSVTTNASGVASCMLNMTRDTLCISVDWTGTSGQVSGLHLHDGMPGMNGPVVVDLSPFISGNRVRTFLTGADLAMLDMEHLMAGMYYLNAHTAANPNGEIRGQVMPESDYSFPLIANGANEVPSVMTPAYGSGTAILSKDMSMLMIHFVMQDLSGQATGAHLHLGSMGTNGGVELDLSDSINGNVIAGVFMNPSQTLIDSLMSDAVYLNVHTSANPNGEIRAQLMHSMMYMYFDARADGMQEVPSVVTSAKASATFWLNLSMDSLWYNVTADGLSGAITASHLHGGALGVNGPVVVDLSSGIMGNNIVGVITGASLNMMLVNEMLKGDVYINIHTAANPGGEIRGQVYRTLREGYTISLDGDQEVPAVATAATGGGLVSIDRDQRNLHLMIVASGLSITGAHFHNAVMGQNGPVIYDLTAEVDNDAIFTYWTNMNTPPFNVMESIRFRNDSVYVNLHTAANPNGEIRGQVMRGYQCSQMITSISEEVENLTLELFPNPVNDQLSIVLPVAPITESTIRILDIAGRDVINMPARLNGNNTRLTVNTSSLTNGVYVLKIEGFYNTKFIKQ